MTAKLITDALVSAVEAWRLVRVILNDPAATVDTNGKDVPVADSVFKHTITTSVAATSVLVTVNSASAPAARELESVVIEPQIVLNVTPVVLLVSCVTAPPEPVTNPTPVPTPSFLLASNPRDALAEGVILRLTCWVEVWYCGMFISYAIVFP